MMSNATLGLVDFVRADLKQSAVCHWRSILLRSAVRADAVVGSWIANNDCQRDFRRCIRGRAFQISVLSVVTWLAPLGVATSASLNYLRGCEFVKGSADTRQVVIASSDKSVALVQITYPGSYLAFPFPAGPRAQTVQSGENFLMLMDGRPLPWVDRHTAKGAPIAPWKLPPRVRFLLYHRYSVKDVLAIRVRTAMGLGWSREMPPLQTQPSNIDGLVEVTNEKIPAYQNMTLFTNAAEGDRPDEIECIRGGSVRFPQCIHEFDYNNINIKASYSYDLLGEWRSIRQILTTFLSCTYSEYNP
ncbi:hypothetical protein [Mesorhizobium sp. LNHC221B00]|uniref:hypothetical protein n=1 Tax=Mesorhizobium sp. LNHC221B00 TaxID=1287233 RepID=UPI0004CF6EA0|nr:hypothetical protein [Mesorhizobium sp. LNHC221B00]